MVWNTRDYYTTPQKWKVAADRLFVSGINQMIYHGFPYQNPLFLTRVIMDFQLQCIEVHVFFRELQ
jgi:hypothetical protein